MDLNYSPEETAFRDEVRGWLDQNRAMLESLMACKRAGADAIFTYFARDVARRLKGR